MVLGSVGSYAFACKALNQPVSVVLALILSISVWIIYLTDHLLDSLKQRSPPSGKYDMFYHRRTFIFILFLLVLLDVFLVIKYLPYEYLLNGVFLGVLMCLYLVAQHFLKEKYRLFFPKEIMISAIYIMAVWFFPVMLTTRLQTGSVLLLLAHFLVVLTNVSLFSFFERSEDIKNAKSSALSRLTESHIKLIISLLCIFSLLSAIASWMFLRLSVSAFVIIALSLIYLLEIYFSDPRLMKSYYAEITDGAFLILLVLLF